MQKCLLSEVNLTLQKEIEIACNIETAETQTSQFKGANTAPVMAVEHMKKGNGTRPETPPDKCGKCTRCGGGNHKAKDCHHKSAKCYKCHKTGQLSSVYRSTTANPSKRNSQHVRWVELQNTDIDSTIFQISGKSPNSFTVELIVQGKTLKFEIDTGASITLILAETYNEQYTNTPLQKSSLTLRTYTGQPIQVLGQITVDVSYYSQQRTHILYVVKVVGPSLWVQSGYKISGLTGRA